MSTNQHAALSQLQTEMAAMRQQLARQEQELAQLRDTTAVELPTAPGTSSRRGMLKQLAVGAAGVAAASAAFGVFDNGLALAAPPQPGDVTPPVGFVAPPLTTGTFYKSYAGVDFLPREGRTQYGYANTPVGTGTAAGAIYVATGFNNGIITDRILSAEVSLPQGATITEVVFYYYDASDTGSIQFSLRRFDPTTRTVGVVFANTSPVSNDSTQTLTVSIPLNTATGAPSNVVDNNYNYRLLAIPNADGDTLQIAGARVGYTLPYASYTNFFTTPGRFLDSRAGSDNFVLPGNTIPSPLMGFAPAATPAAAQLYNYNIVGNASKGSGPTIPAGAKGIFGNITVIGNSTDASGGYAVLYPSTGAFPSTSVINYGTGQIVANAFSVSIGNGNLKLAVYKSADVILDVTGYYM